MPRLLDRNALLSACFAVATAVTALGAAPARAADNTDLWFTASQPGSGYNLVQSDNFIFVTFFIYGADKQPTWYTAQLTLDSTGKYSGGLYRTTGTYYAGSFNSADSSIQQVGSASFTPSAANAYQGTLTYTVTGVGTVTKAIERQGLTSITIAGQYVGGESGSFASCANSANNFVYTDKYDLAVTQSVSGTATLSWAYAGGSSCQLSGQLEQHGTLYRIANAVYSCDGDTAVSATLFELKATSLGIEGRLFGAFSDACQNNANFSAVLR